MQKFLLACTVATLSLSAAPLWAAPTRSESVADLLMSGDAKGALKAVDQWKAAKGEADPEYWLAAAAVHYKLAGDAPPMTLDREVHYDPQKVRVAMGFLDEGVRRFPYRYDLWSMRVELAKSLHDLKAELDALTSLATGPKPKNGKLEMEGGQPLSGPYEQMCVTELNTAARDHLNEKTAAGDRAGRQIAELSIKLFPKAAEGYNALGAALERSGDKPGAIAQYQRVVAMNSNPLQVDIAKDRLEELKAPAARR